MGGSKSNAVNLILRFFLYHILHTMSSWRHKSIHNSTNKQQTPPPCWWSCLPLQRRGFDESTKYEWRATQQRGRARDKRTPPLQAILMAMRTHWSDARGIAWFSKSRATLDAPGCRHWMTTSSVLPQQPPGQQKNKQQSIMTLKRWPNWWPWQYAGTLPCTSPDGGGLGLSKMPLNATIGRVLWPILTIGHACAGFFQCFHRQSRRKRLQIDAKAPVFNKGITYKMKEKGLTKVTI